MLTSSQLDAFRQDGHVTVPDVFDEASVNACLHDIAQWGEEFLAQMSVEQRTWFLEQRGVGVEVKLRKLDEPVFHRPCFRQLAKAPQLVTKVEQLIGQGVSVFFSQVFCKPAEIGGPKPVHQDNYYFGPNDPDATLTVWIALDDATVENGCLFYGNGSHRGGVYPHVAPPDEPFNLQISTESLADYVMTAAPVSAGGVSFHHGSTWHQSSSNTSSMPRRAAAFHFLRNDAVLEQPALKYDPNVVVRIS